MTYTVYINSRNLSFRETVDDATTAREWVADEVNSFRLLGYEFTGRLSEQTGLQYTGRKPGQQVTVGMYADNRWLSVDLPTVEQLPFEGEGDTYGSE